MVIRRIILIIVMINLINYFHIINPDRVFYFTIYSGISLNISDFLAIIMLIITFFSTLFSKDQIRSELLYLLIYLFSSVIAICLLSFLALDASLGAIGGRLRQYFYYFLIPGTIYLIKDEKDLRFFFLLIFALGTIGSLIQYLEFVNGKPFFYIPGTGVGEHFSSGVMKVENIPRIWSRNESFMMFTFAVSMGCVLLRLKDKMVFIFLLAVSLISILLDLTRTVYILTIISILVIVFICLRRNFGSSVLFSLILLLILLTSLFFIFGKSTMDTFATRFTSTRTAITDVKHPSTFHARVKQFDYRMEKMRKSSYPTIFGMGITDESVKLVTGDLGYINIFLNLGILGLVFVFWVYVYLYKKCFRLKKKIKEGFYNCVLIGIIGLATGMIIAGINFDYFTLRAKFPLLFLCVVSVELIDKFNRKGIVV